MTPVRHLRGLPRAHHVRPAVYLWLVGLEFGEALLASLLLYLVLVWDLVRVNYLLVRLCLKTSIVKCIDPRIGPSVYTPSGSSHTV